jgi:nucleotide-binding universal stress UspA family protein
MTDAGGTALATAAELSDRLDLRLVLAYVGDGNGQLADSVVDHAEQRWGAGDAATVIGQIAAAEAADLIVVGARARGRFRRGRADASGAGSTVGSPGSLAARRGFPS